MTDEQRAALDALTAKRRAFVLAFIGEARGNATEAARRAGYAAPTEEGHRLLRNAQVAAAVEALRAPVEREAIANVEELRAFWTSVQRGQVSDVTRDGTETRAGLAVRMRASELLARSLGAFVPDPVDAPAPPRSREEALARLDALRTKLLGPGAAEPRVVIAYDVIREIAQGGDE